MIRSDKSYTLSPQIGFLSKDSNHSWGLEIHCASCKNYSVPPSERYRDNSTCLECILTILRNVKKKKVENIEFESNFLAPSQDVQLLNQLTTFYILWQKLRICQITECVFSEGTKFSTFIGHLVKNPHSLLCPSCNRAVRDIKKTNMFAILMKIPPTKQWQDALFIGPYFETTTPILTQISAEQNILTSYKISHFPLYTVTIYSNVAFENILNSSIHIGTKSPEFYDALIINVKRYLTTLTFDHLLPIGSVLDTYVKHISNYLSLNYHNLDSEEIRNIALFASVEIMNISKLFPLLVDDLLDEIYLDGPRSKIYVDHREFGRCTTSISLTERDINAIQTFLRISSNKRLDSSNPTIKCSIHNRFFHCRFAVDISPVIQSGFSIDIRKMNRKIFTIPELISRRMLSSQVAAFLYLCVVMRINVTAVGETNTGKTTLINSLDLLTPSHYRKIYIEESSESLDQSSYSAHQVKYLVDPSYQNRSKITEIYRLLHRSPDIVYLGEILTHDEAHAMFHCLSAGLRGFQTIHARDVRSLLNRWQYHFEIDPACYNDLGLVILLKRDSVHRFITDIVEISYSNGQVKINPIIQYDPEMREWSSLPKIEKLQCFRRISLPQKDITYFTGQIEFFKTLFHTLSKEQDWDVNNHVSTIQSLYNKIELLKLRHEDIKWENLMEAS